MIEVVLPAGRRPRRPTPSSLAARRSSAPSRPLAGHRHPPGRADRLVRHGSAARGARKLRVGRPRRAAEQGRGPPPVARESGWRKSSPDVRRMPRPDVPLRCREVSSTAQGAGVQLASFIAEPRALCSAAETPRASSAHTERGAGPRGPRATMATRRDRGNFSGHIFDDSRRLVPRRRKVAVRRARATRPAGADGEHGAP